MLDFINVNQYEEVCDLSIVPAENKLFTSEFLQRDAIIFCKTDYIDYLFQNLKSSFHKYVLVTNYSDYPINFERFYKKPVCIKKWCGINVEFKHPDLIAVPLGLYSSKGHTKNVFIKFDIIWFLENRDRLYANEKNLKEVYCNWASTNANRNKIIEQLKQSNIKYYWESGLTVEQYYENMSKYKFVISPPGNGIDCFRTYEALYFNCIPIVIKHPLYDNWKELPIIQVKDYSEVTYELLYSYLDKEYNMEKLYMTYWRNLIQKIFNEL
jgi:hypothetical protein